jgi:hypothetical protein
MVAFVARKTGTSNQDQAQIAREGVRYSNEQNH